MTDAAAPVGRIMVGAFVTTLTEPGEVCVIPPLVDAVGLVVIAAMRRGRRWTPA